MDSVAVEVVVFFVEVPSGVVVTVSVVSTPPVELPTTLLVVDVTVTSVVGAETVVVVTSVGLEVGSPDTVVLEVGCSEVGTLRVVDVLDCDWVDFSVVVVVVSDGTVSVPAVELLIDDVVLFSVSVTIVVVTISVGTGVPSELTSSVGVTTLVTVVVVSTVGPVSVEPLGVVLVPAEVLVTTSVVVVVTTIAGVVGGFSAKQPRMSTFKLTELSSSLLITYNFTTAATMGGLNSC